MDCISSKDLVNKAVKAFADGNHVEAVKLLEKVIAEFPDFIEAWVNLGTFYSETNNPEKALTYFTKAVELDSMNSTYWFYLAITYCDLQQYTQSLDASITALALDPNNQKIWLNHGYILEQANLPRDSSTFDSMKSDINKKRQELGLPSVTIN